MVQAVDRTRFNGLRGEVGSICGLKRMGDPAVENRTKSNELLRIDSLTLTSVHRVKSFPVADETRAGTEE